MLPNVKDKTLAKYNIDNLKEAFKHALIGALENEANRNSDIKTIFNLCDANTKRDLIKADNYLAIDIAFRNVFTLLFVKIIPINELFNRNS